MSCSLSLEKSLTIAYLGPEATYTHQAAIRKFGHSLRYAPQKTIKDVFSEVEKDRADYGVVPIENSTEGVVTHTLDLFVESPLKIVAQIVMPIQHCLVRNNRRTKVRMRTFVRRLFRTRQCWIGITICATIFSGLSTNRSSVWVTTPSVEFSIGTTP